MFDEQHRLEKLRRQNGPPRKLSSHIYFEYFRKSLKQFFDKASDTRKSCPPACDNILIFKIQILKRYYNLSGDSIEYAVLDRLSFMRFLGLAINNPVPYAKSIRLFRGQLTQGGIIEKLLQDLDRQLEKDGIIVHSGKLVDATIVELAVQRNSRNENKDLKEGNISQELKDNENKLRQKDTDA